MANLKMPDISKSEVSKPDEIKRKLLEIRQNPPRVTFESDPKGFDPIVGTMKHQLVKQIPKIVGE